jgi:hypothetical protein
MPGPFLRLPLARPTGRIRALSSAHRLSCCGRKESTILEAHMSSTPRHRAVATLVALLALVAWSSACGDDNTGDYAATADGFVIEPADEVGPDAFTAPTDTGEGGTCDKAALLTELESRPDALREWAAVLGVQESEVATYIDTLQPRILEADTDVTNHGLHDGQAYARQSRLVAGTAVLVDPNFTEPVTAGTPDPAGLDTTTSMPTTTGAPTTSAPSTTGPPPTEQPVTRCKCGNPLLPPFTRNAPITTASTTSTDEGDTTEPSGRTTTTKRPTTSTGGTTPPEESTTPPEDGTTPPEDGTTPPEEGTTPPEQDDTPPEENDDDTPSPPGDVLVD